MSALILFDRRTGGIPVRHIPDINLFSVGISELLPAFSERGRNNKRYLTRAEVELVNILYK